MSFFYFLVFVGPWLGLAVMQLMAMKKATPNVIADPSRPAG